MNVHELTMAAVKRFTQPVTAPIIQSEITPKLSYPTVLQCLNDLVRQGKLTESRNAVDKRVFSVK